MTSTVIKRNPYVSKWNILFDTKTSEWISFKPQLGLTVYPCYACRDMFGSKSSFLDHVNRRSILLKYKCPSCTENNLLTFYNPCAVLLHARRHFSLINGEIDLANLEVSTLPFGLGGLLPHPDIPLLYDVEENQVDQSIYMNNRFYSPIPQNLGQQIVCLFPNELFFYMHSPNNTSVSLVLRQTSSNIPRCVFVMFDGNQYNAVMNNLNDNLQNGGVHDKIQVKEEPSDFIDDNVSDTNTLNNNENETENYPRCSECHLIQKNSLPDHFLKDNKPIDEKLRCGTCNIIATSKCSLSAHLRLHNESPPFVCPECGKDFDDFKQLNSHVNLVCFHLYKQIRFRCPGKKCGKLFAQTNTYASHFVMHMECFNKCTVCKAVFLKLDDYMVHSKTHERCSNMKLYKCSVCVGSTASYTENNYLSHVHWHVANRKQCMYVYICRRCRNYFRSKQTYAIHLLKCTKPLPSVNPHKKDDKSRFVTVICLNCKAKVTFMANALSTICPKCDENLNGIKETVYRETQHRLTEVNVNESVYICNKCNKEVKMDEVHGAKECSGAIASDPLSTDEPTAASPKQDEGSKRKRRKSVSSGSKSKKLNSDIEEILIEPAQFDGTYTCVGCSYTTIAREAFQSHVIIHRDVSTAYQCMECGECFVVKPSFLKHLTFCHKITDTDQYMEHNNCYDKEAVKKLEEHMKLTPGETKEPVAENQCRVCLQQCSDESDLKKHTRMHGMAFLMQNTK